MKKINYDKIGEMVLTVFTYVIVSFATFMHCELVNEAKINYLESELRSVRYHYLKCSTALLDSNLHAKCFKLGE